MIHITENSKSKKNIYIVTPAYIYSIKKYKFLDIDTRFGQ